MLRRRPDVTCWASFLNEVAARGSAAPAAAPVAPARVPVPLPMPLVPAVARQARLAPAGQLSEAA
ncbi:MAG: hypothetical protein QOF99_5512 [Pseudonocardiales bacterium]|nr:hypothetical protein [Pseudonocardiales bacterium]